MIPFFPVQSVPAREQQNTQRWVFSLLPTFILDYNRKSQSS